MAQIDYTKQEVELMKKRIRTLRELIAEADHDDPGMRKAITDWEQEIDNLEYSVSGAN